jgi:PAS domain S-box-containing protein
MHKEIPPKSVTIKERYGKFFDYSREGIIISGEKGQIIEANATAARILGYKDSQELIGIESLELYKDPVDRKYTFEKLKKDGYVDNLALTFNTKTGDHVHLMGSAIASRDKDGNITQVEGIFTDITELRHTENKLKSLHAQLEEKVEKRTAQLQKRNKQLMKEIRKRRQIEKKLKTSETKFRNLIQTAPDGIYILDLKGRIISRNKAAIRLGGFKDEEVIGKKFHETPSFPLENVNKYKKIFKDFLTGKIKPPIELDFQTESGEQKTAEAHFSLIQEKGKTLGIQAILRDITGKKKTEKELKEGEKKLKEQNILLEEKNIALREVMGQLKEEKDRFKKQILLNLDKLIFPIIERIKLRCKKKEDHQFILLLEDNLKNLISPFGQEVSKKASSLTPKEIEICNMIAGGMSSKEIGRMLAVSFRTIETHRNNIRKKLGIQNEKVNLNSYLNSMKLGPLQNT